MSLALEPFDQYDNHVFIKLLLDQVRISGLIDFRALSLFTGLHCASYFGIVGVAAALMEKKGCDVNQGDCAGNTPLIWAAMLGYEGLVRLLLKHENIDPDVPHKSGQTPLLWTAKNGHEEA